MCMTFRMSGGEAAALIALGVLFAPVWIAGAIVYVPVKGGKKLLQMRRDHRLERNQRRNEEWRAAEAARQEDPTLFLTTDNTAFNDLLQEAYDRATEAPSCESVMQLACGLFAKKDFYGAHVFLLKAEALAVEAPTQQRATLHYFIGLTLQLLGKFTDAATRFHSAAELLDSLSGVAFVEIDAPAESKESEEGVEGLVKETVESITALEARLQEAYSLYLSAAYPDIDSRDGHHIDIGATLSESRNMLDAILDKNPDHLKARLILGFVCYREFLPTEHPSKSWDCDAFRADWAVKAYSHAKAVADATEEAHDTYGVEKATALSLAAHALVGMGERSQGLELIHEARDIDATVHGATAPQYHLFAMDMDTEPHRNLYKKGCLQCAPWPLPPSVLADDRVQFHDFEKHFFKTPTFCDLCMGFISLGENCDGAYRCKTCKYEVHGKCLKDAEKQFCMLTCKRTTIEAHDTSHTHLFKEHRMHRTRDCAICHEAIMLGRTAGQCELCNQYAHQKCMANCDAISSPK